MALFHSFVAGSSIDEAVEVCRPFNRDGIACSLSYLPISQTDPQAVEADASEYLSALETIGREQLDADLTIKLHQLGIHGDPPLAETAVRRIVAAAEAAGSFVWIDMETRETVDATIEIYRRVASASPSVGICLQAYLERTDEDLDRLLDEGAAVRLVKGFYRRNDVASWREVTRRYSTLMVRLLDRSPRPAIATHDLDLVEQTVAILRRKALCAAELQFFLGVRDELARELRAQGLKVRIYIPYGRVARYWFSGFRTFDLRRQAQRLMGFRPRP